jgi:tRNA threonylcarbamoyladenosine biosynthesis protein TsaB
MALLLHLETATKNCSVALGKEGAVLDCLEQATEGYSHAEQLHVFIDQILKRNQLEPSRLDGIVVSKGPGSYTGLRIGVSAAKGLAYALQIPLLSLRTTQVLAQSTSVKDVLEPGAHVIPLIDARRMEVYAEVFNDELISLKPVHAEILESNSFEEFDSGKRIFVGDGAQKSEEPLGSSNNDFLNEYPSAQYMVALGQKKFEAEDFEDTAYFEPFYFKEFVAGMPKKLI